MHLITKIYQKLKWKFLEITAGSIGWYLGGTVGIGTLLFAFGVGPAVALGLFFVGKIFL